MIVYIVAEATTVVTFALDVTVLFCKLPYFRQFDDGNNYVLSCYLKKRNVNELYLEIVYRPRLIIFHVTT